VASGTGRAKLAEVVAAEIENDIIARGWPIGVVVGSEAELLQRYKVSRAVLREALRIVEHHFVATMRRGPGGGLVVTEPDVEAIVRAVALQLEYQGIKPQHLHEARTLLEVTCVRLAVQRLTTLDTAQLREQMAIDRTAPGRAQNFHVWIAQLTGNPALALFVSVLGLLMRDHLTIPQSAESVTGELNRSHSAIAKALIERDGERAERLLVEHLERVKRWINVDGESLASTGRRRT
jgi:DNA-binding FadR family transcriptional regulator